MKNYRVTVNGNVYDVTVEECVAGTNYAPVTPLPVAVPVAMPAQSAPVAAPAQQAPVAAPVAAPVEAVKPVSSGVAGTVKVTAPMPGKILKVVAKEGQTVKKGQALIVLEAMKMENEIVAPQDGTVASINVSMGVSVESNDVLATLN